MGGNVSDRHLPNWINSFTRLTKHARSPEIFRKWTGISILGSALERKVWSSPNAGVLFPNLYVVLVGPPGTGKSQVIKYADELLRKIDKIKVAPSSVTTASLIDSLQLAECTHFALDYSKPFLKYHSLQVVSSEFQNFLPAYEASFMGLLTKLYDCELYEERRRTGKVNHAKIDATQLSILAGTTPSYLNSLLPDGAWDQGFTSRTIFIYSDKPKDVQIIFGGGDDPQELNELHEDLIHDLRVIFEMRGQILWDLGAQIMLQNWAAGGEQPVPEHSRLVHYNSRRITHILKLGTIASIARGDDMKVTVEDLNTAMGWLLEAESFMPDIFRTMMSTAESRTMEDAKFHITQLAVKLKGPVPEHYLIGFLRQREKPQNIQKMIDMMVRSRMLKHTYDANGNAFYSPLEGRT